MTITEWATTQIYNTGWNDCANNMIIWIAIIAIAAFALGFIAGHIMTIHKGRSRKVVSEEANVKNDD